MKNINLLTFAALVGLATTASAQGFDPYRQGTLSSTCVANPYAQKGYGSAQPVPQSTITPPLFNSYAVRYSIAQGSVGTPGQERAYLNISNLEDTDQEVAVRLTVEGKECPLFWTGTVPANGRTSLGLHADASLWGHPWNFSVVVYFSLNGGDADLTNYDGRQVETGTKPGKLVPR